MLTAGTVLLVSLLYLGVLFAIASYGDRRADQGRSLIRSPYVYTLSLGVYCTAWTFYGSVGLASRQGLDFLPIYLGPTLAALLFGFLVQKMLRITKAQGITSIADFIARPLRQERPARGPGHRRRDPGRDPLHRAPAQGGGLQRHGADRRRRPGRSRAPAVPTPRFLVLLLLAPVQRPVRHPPHRRHRAPRGHGAGRGVRERGQARRPS